MNKYNKNKLLDTNKRIVVTTVERESGEGGMGKGGEIYMVMDGNQISGGEHTIDINYSVVRLKCSCY